MVKKTKKTTRKCNRNHTRTRQMNGQIDRTTDTLGKVMIIGIAANMLK